MVDALAGVAKNWRAAENGLDLAAEGDRRLLVRHWLQRTTPFVNTSIPPRNSQTMHSRIDTLRHASSLIVLLGTLLLTACSSTMPVGIPSNHTGPTASVKGTFVDPVRFFAAKNSHCSILDVDGSWAAKNEKAISSKSPPPSVWTVIPGNHRFKLLVGVFGAGLKGEVVLDIPQAGTYTIEAYADRARHLVELRVIDEKTKTNVSTATLPADI
jgi:hypothetical protein